ncbi:PIN domain-containing protein [Streptomyces sp. NPDC102282]|uniref:PIN domain-containing protein n=1 Tax=Streptomyces sp. NPDC102282 TaxID=3366154 RepID=UPI003801C10B
MPKKPPPPTYVDQLLSELADMESSYQVLLDSSQVKARQMNHGGIQILGHPWAWVPSTPDAETSRMGLLRQVRDWAPRFRLLFPHPTPKVQRGMDDAIRLLEDWLVRKREVKYRAPADIPSAKKRLTEAAAALRELVELLPPDDWNVRVVVDTNTLIDDPDVTLYKDSVGSRYMVHLLPVVLREVDDLKRSHNRPELREAARRADRRLKAMRDNGDVRVGARIAGEVYAIFEHIEPRADGLPTWLDLDVPDDRFIASTLLLQSQHPGSKLYAATSDINLQTKLAAVGLPYVEGPPGK